MEESASRKAYSSVTHCETSLPALIAGLNLTSQAARMAFSVRPKGSRLTTLTRSSFPSAKSNTLENHDSLNAHAARFARVTGFGSRSDFGL